MDRQKKRRRTVYTHNPTAQGSSASSATQRRVHVEHHPAAPRSPEKNRTADVFDQLMGFADEVPAAPIISEGPAALKIKFKKRYENSVCTCLRQNRALIYIHTGPPRKNLDPPS
jgi:hypothetical protein